MSYSRCEYATKYKRYVYPNLRCTIDATEIYIEQPSSPEAQQLTFSSYKNHNTLKALIGISPSGSITFVSDLYGGNISDKRTHHQVWYSQEILG